MTGGLRFNHVLLLTNWPLHEKTCLWRFANNKDADQPTHPCSLISTFVINILESIISRFATSEIFLLVSVAEQALNLNLSEIPKTSFFPSGCDFLAPGPKWM